MFFLLKYLNAQPQCKYDFNFVPNIRIVHKLLLVPLKKAGSKNTYLKGKANKFIETSCRAPVLCK